MNANPAAPVDSGFINLKTIPKDADAGSNRYVITYRTKKHSAGGAATQVALDYGPQMASNKYSPDQITQASFTGKNGDNLMWDTLYWRFTIDGTPVVYKTTMDSANRGVGNPEDLILPVKKIQIPGGAIMDAKYLQSMPSYPFENGILRKASELARDSKGNIAFVDSSDEHGMNSKLPAVESQVKLSDGVAALKGAGPEFETSNQYRYYNGKTLAKLTGEADIESPKIIASILSQQPGPSSKATPGAGGKPDSVFEPIEDKNSKNLSEHTTRPKAPGANANNPTGLAKMAADSKESLDFNQVALEAEHATKAIKDLNDASNAAEKNVPSSTSITSPTVSKMARNRVIIGYTQGRVNRV
jgi:hypothetical protein